MAVLRKDEKGELKNALLRVSMPAPLMAEIKKTKKLCRDNGLYFDIKPDVIDVVEKALEEAKELVAIEMKNRVNQ